MIVLATARLYSVADTIIQKPVRFYAIISRAIEFYDKFETNLTKDHAHAMVLKFPSNATNKRIYFEFFLSPEGNFLEQETLIKTSNAKMNIATQTIGPNLILVIRYAVMGNQKEQHLDKEIAILPDNLDQTVYNIKICVKNQAKSQLFYGLAEQ